MRRLSFVLCPGFLLALCVSCSELRGSDSAPGASDSDVTVADTSSDVVAAAETADDDVLSAPEDVVAPGDAIVGEDTSVDTSASDVQPGEDIAADTALDAVLTDAAADSMTEPDSRSDAGADGTVDDVMRWPTGTWLVGLRDTTLVDSSRENRRVYARVRAPEGLEDLAPLILVSHGGSGSERGYQSGAHLGDGFASAGYVVVHVGHVESTDNEVHLLDRPADVSFVLDALASGEIGLPDTFVGRIDFSRVGHIGHSYGAYTAHAVGGADYEQGNFRDERIDAIVALSPQGAGQFGGYDRGGSDNTWATLPVPVYGLVGGDEVDTNALGVFQAEGWRLQPSTRYPDTIDSYYSVVPNQGHSEMWNRGSEDVEQYIVNNVLPFLDRHVRGSEVNPCDVGSQRPDVDATTTRRLVREDETACR